MANKQVFTAFDVYGFKKALALWAAKNNALIEKYEKVLNITKNQIESLYEEKPSPARDSTLFCWESVKEAYEIFLKDLKTPCDCFIFEFEFQNVGKENG